MSEVSDWIQILEMGGITAEGEPNFACGVFCNPVRICPTIG